MKLSKIRTSSREITAVFIGCKNTKDGATFIPFEMKITKKQLQMFLKENSHTSTASVNGEILTHTFHFSSY